VRLNSHENELMETGKMPVTTEVFTLSCGDSRDWSAHRGARALRQPQERVTFRIQPLDNYLLSLEVSFWRSDFAAFAAFLCVQMERSLENIGRAFLRQNKQLPSSEFSCVKWYINCYLLIQITTNGESPFFHLSNENT